MINRIFLIFSDSRRWEAKVTSQTERSVTAMAACWLLLISHHEVHWLEKETVSGQTESQSWHQHNKAGASSRLCPPFPEVREQSTAKLRILPHQTESLSRRQNQEWSHPETSRESFKCQFDVTWLCFLLWTACNYCIEIMQSSLSWESRNFILILSFYAVKDL